MREAFCPQTRKDKKIDLLLNIFDTHIKGSKALEPLSKIEGQLSDHMSMSFTAVLPKIQLGKKDNNPKKEVHPRG